MAEEETEQQATQRGGLIPKLVIWGVVFVLGVGTGVSVPLLLMSPSTSVANARGPSDTARMDIPEPDDQVAFIDFDEVVVNLNDVRYSRYVTCTFSLQIAKSQELAIQQLVDEREVVLKNWLIAHLRDKKLEDVRGKLGHNALRREIHDQFNKMLFTDGIERIVDVLFQDFKVQ